MPLRISTTQSAVASGHNKKSPLSTGALFCSVLLRTELLILLLVYCIISAILLASLTSAQVFPCRLSPDVVHEFVYLL